LRRLRRSGGILAINACLLVVLLFVVEAAARLLRVNGGGVGSTPTRSLWRYDETKGWSNRPGAVGVVGMSSRRCGSGCDEGKVRINSLGLRGPEVGDPKPAGVYRVGVFGDSFAFGVGLDEEHTLSEQLGASLRRQSDRPIEVVNAAVSGYATDQELILFRELAPRLALDAVVLVVCDNDFAGNTEDFAYKQYYKPFFTVEEGKLALHNSPVPTLDRPQRAKLWLAEHSHLWNLLRSAEPNGRIGRWFVGWFAVGVARSAPDEQVLTTAALVRTFAEEAASARASFLVVNTGRKGEDTSLVRALFTRLERSRISVLRVDKDLKEARERDPHGLWDFDPDSHWNVDATRVVAELVARHLAGSGEARNGLQLASLGR
jgi:hypothetical protein